MQGPPKRELRGAELANAAILKPPKPPIPAALAPESTAAPQCIFAMLSHRGRVRHANQDSCAAALECGAFVVCDGVGGAAAGDVASQLAAETFLQTLNDNRQEHARRAPAKAAPSNGHARLPTGHPHARLHAAVHAANQAVLRRSRKSTNLRGMGTTLVGALWSSDAQTLWLAHVGDSRCYLLRRGKLHLLTQDHSLVEEQVRAGAISRGEAETSPMRNIITRAIGTQSCVQPDIAAHPVHPGDLFLLTSDGLTRELSETEIARILAQVSPANSKSALQTACQQLVDAANANGGRDNITVLLLARG